MAICYLDNFLAILSKADEGDINVYEIFFTKTCETLEFSINTKKNVTSTLAKLLGIGIDKFQMKARLP